MVGASPPSSMTTTMMHVRWFDSERDEKRQARCALRPPPASATAQAVACKSDALLPRKKVARRPTSDFWMIGLFDSTQYFRSILHGHRGRIRLVGQFLPDDPP